MIPFQITTWDNLPAVNQPAAKGLAIIKTLELAGLRIRMVEYSANYEADHWCEKGHIAYCISGELLIELLNDKNCSLNEGASFEVSDNMSSHKVYSKKGAKLFIIDGEFLQSTHKK